MSDQANKKGDSKMMGVSLAQYNPVSTIENFDRKGWVNYGDENRFPDYLIDLALSAPVHGALCKSIASMIAGKGLVSTDPKTQARIEELNLNKVQRKCAKDLKIQGGYYLEIIWTKDFQSIGRIVCLPFVNVRVSTNDETGEINGIWFSRDWFNTRKDKNKPRYIPLFNPDLANQQPNQCLIKFGEVEGSDIYPKPDYWPSVNYIELSKQIGIYHVNNIMNGLFPSFMIAFRNGIPDEDVQRKIMAEWERNVSGTRNAGKFMINFSESDRDAPEVTQFPITDADKQYQFLSGESTAQVMIGHRVTTPRVFGVMDTGNGLSSNTDEMKVGLAIFKSEVVEPAQRFIAEGFEDILRAEGLTGTIETEQNSTLADAIEPAAPAPTQMSLKKKSIDSDTAGDALIELGTDIDSDWIEIDSFIEDEIELAVSSGTAKPNLESAQDKVIDGKKIIARYRYSGNLAENSRAFCKKVHSANKYYRKEDIMAMGKVAVNPGWGPNGADTYSIWQYKGGGDCHHKWETVIFISAKGLGIDVNSPKAKTIAIDKAKELGYSVRNNYKVAQEPRDMPHRGFLPKDN